MAPGRFRERVEYLKWTNTLATSSSPQLAMANFLQSGGYEHHVRKLRRIYSKNARRKTEVGSRYFPVGTKVSRPTGGMALWVELPEHIRALAVYERALAQRISIAPGPIFLAKQGFQNFLRLNFGNPWTDQIERAVLRLGQIITAVGAESSR